MNEPDLVNKPPHHRAGSKYETIRVIEAWNLGFLLGNVIKYVARHALKGTPLQDLKKARWYLNRKIKQLEKEKKNASSGT